MTKSEIEEIKEIFNSIICLSVEGAELFSATKILNLIYKEAEKGYNLAGRHLTPAALDKKRRCHVCKVEVGEKHKPFCSVGHDVFCR